MSKSEFAPHWEELARATASDPAAPIEQLIPCTTDPDLFYPDGPWHLSAPSEAKAKALCQTCTILRECVEYALDNDEVFGVWGGLTQSERRRVRTSRAKGAGQVA